MKRKVSVFSLSVGRWALSVERSRARSGATLLVTLGVLTVVSVLIATFLLTARHQRQSAKRYRDKTVARQALDVALQRAMQFADGAMIASNYVNASSTPIDPGSERLRRAAPVNAWYRRDYQPDPDSEITDKVNYQTQDVLLVPVIKEDDETSFKTNALTVNLLTEEVCRLLPPALTNRFSGTEKLRSGWIDLGTGTRVSFAVVNVSGFIDAHRYDFSNGLIQPATQTYTRAYYDQQDLANNPRLTPEEIEDKTTLSFDPGPDAIPYYQSTAVVDPRLGLREFPVTNKFCLSTLTNFFDTSSAQGYERLRVTLPFEYEWLRSVSNQLNAAQAGGDVVLGDVGKLAWNIAAYMTPSRVPMISFPGVALASRADYGIEDVPLINEVSVFNCCDEDGNYDALFDQRISDIKNELQLRFEQEVQQLFPDGSVTLAPISTISNVYAAAVELWYPFAPRPINDVSYPDSELRVYLGVYTNQAQILTTTNTQWTASDLADWYGLNDPTVAQLEAYIWNDLYESDPDTVTNSLFWQLIETNELVVAVIQDPDTLDQDNLLDFSTGLATGYIGVYTDPATGLVPTNNPYRALLETYAPASTNLTPEEAALYYATPANYIPALVTVLTSRVDEVDRYEEGGFSSSRQSLMQRYLPAEKIQVGPFGEGSMMWTPDNPLRNEDFNTHGFCAITNTTDLVYFPILEKNPDEKVCRVVFLPLGGTCKLWVRPLVAVKEPGNYGLSENDGYEPADEALLVKEGENSQVTVVTWPPSEAQRSPEGREEYCLSVADPRNNAWGSDWYSAPNSFGSANRRLASGTDEGTGDSSEEGTASGATDMIPGVAELPFIHADQPFRSIGELGFITADLDAKLYNQQNHRHPLDKVRDTVDFSTRTGAALLDRFTLSPTNRPMRGLVQANTPYDSVIRKLLEHTPLGWTNDLYEANAHLQELEDPRLSTLSECWTNTLFKVYDPMQWDRQQSGLPGWRCFSDMLPDLSTNILLHAEPAVADLEDDAFYRHDYVEDIMRNFIDHVSFRQNIFVVVIAAQTLSPASSAQSPVILSDQRAAVTVLRDAFTGRWMINDWTWLTE